MKCLHPMFSLVTLVRGVEGKLSRLVYLAPHPGFGSGSVISRFLLLHNLGIFSCKRCEHYFSQTVMFASNVQLGYPCPRGGKLAVQAGLSCPLPRIWNSVNSCCTIILEYLFVRDMNIISVKLRCLYLTFSLVILVWGGGRGAGGASCPGWFILHPPHNTSPRIWVRQCHQSILTAP